MITKRELVVNLKSIRVSVTKKAYEQLMKENVKAHQKLGEELLNKIKLCGMHNMIESFEYDEEAS